MHHLDWYQKQQVQRKEHMNNNEVFLINQELKRLLQRVQPFINRKDYEVEAQKASRHLVQSSIWDISYRNNMENLQVAVEQAMLIQTILSKEEDITHAKTIKIEVERQMRRLGNVDWGVYTNYRGKIQHLH